MFQVLHDCGALSHILPELDALWAPLETAGSAVPSAVSIAASVDLTARMGYSLPIRFSVLGLGQGDSIGLTQALCAHLRVPNECRDLALMCAREQSAVGDALNLSADAMVALLMRCDAFRKPQRFIDMLCAQQCAQAGWLQNQPEITLAWPPQALLSGALRAAQAVKAGELARLYTQSPERIPEAIYAARVGAVAEFRDAFVPDGRC
jgi:tRNA nucleotidyltransferase (CCA-adding enzyme)